MSFKPTVDLKLYFCRMELSLLAFGIAREIVGGRKLVLTLPDEPTTVDSLKALLAERYPAFKAIRSLAIAVNGEYGDNTRVVNATDEVALIPPVSGG